LLLNHINLPVADVAATRDFFVTYFGMKTLMELPKNSLAILQDEGGMVLNLSHFDRKSEIHYHKDFHVGFFLKTRDEVDALHVRMAADGIAGEPPRKHPGDFVVEVACIAEEAWAS
jgi:catechol 2,3-dioxygenase-like lactoylglutathione lyase family enzyme